MHKIFIHWINFLKYKIYYKINVMKQKSSFKLGLQEELFIIIIIIMLLK